MSPSTALCVLVRRNFPIPSIRATEFLLDGPEKVVMLELLTDDVYDDVSDGVTDDTRRGRLRAEFSRVVESES